MIEQGALTIVAALVVAGIVALFKRRRIFLVSPRLLGHSALSATGHVLEVTLLNRGLTSEEDISVCLNPRCSYDLLAASTHEASLSGGTLTVPRLVPEDEFTVILQAEGPNDPDQRIVQATSKAAKVLVVDRYEEIGPSTRDLGTVSAVGVLVLAVLFFGGRELVSTFTESQKLVAQEHPIVAQEHPIGTPTPDPAIEARISSYRALGWTVDKDWIASRLSTQYKGGELPVRVLACSRHGNYIRVPIRFSNQLDEAMRVSANLLSPAGEGPKWTGKDHIFSLAIFPGKAREKILEAYLPRSSTEKRIILEVTLFVGEDLFNFRYEWSPETA